MHVKTLLMYKHFRNEDKMKLLTFIKERITCHSLEKQVGLSAGTIKRIRRSPNGIIILELDDKTNISSDMQDTIAKILEKEFTA